MTMMQISRRAKWLGGFALLFPALQLVPVDRSNPPVHSEPAAPAAVAEVLRRSCYDCHSHETRWAWYAYVAPASWKVAHDVAEAREELNFSDWLSYRTDKRARLLEEVLEEVEEEHMPPGYYTVLHPDARLSAAELAQLRNWVESAEN